MLINSPLIKFIQQEGPVAIKRLLYLSVLVGLSSTCVVALLNNSAMAVSKGEGIVIYFCLFLFVMLFYVVVLNKFIRQNVAGAQNLIHRFKMRLMKQVIEADLEAVDAIGRNEIFQVLIRDSQSVSQAIPIVASAFQSAAMLIFMLGYLLTQSLIISLIVIVSISIIIVFMSQHFFRIRSEMVYAWQKEGQSFEIIGDFLAGFKEIKMNSLLASEITADLVAESRFARDLKTHSMILMGNAGNALHISSYIIIAAIVFIAPTFSDDVASQILTSITTVLFLAGSVGALVTSFPILSQANASAEELVRLETRLQEASNLGNGRNKIVYEDLQKVELQNISYHYSEAKGSSADFHLGPINCIFEAGKIYFIRGNNGSGKSTLVKILLGLAKPAAGNILFNDVLVKLPASTSYRDHFAVVFSDFHLFKKLYGVPKFDEDVLQEVVNILKMQGKIELEDGIFTNLNLSTGQKKRVALMVALLEGKKFIVLDEWASDQDPEFRKYFYREIIPSLKEIGKTIIAITHDDQYFDVADQVLVMEKGKLL